MDDTETTIIDAWKLCQDLSLRSPEQLAPNLGALVETRDYLITAINLALKEKATAP